MGRIEEIRAEKKNGEWIITEYHIGFRGLMERLAATTFAGSLAHLFRPSKNGEPRCIPWDKLDLSDPEHPRYLGRKSDLEKQR